MPENCPENCSFSLKCNKKDCNLPFCVRKYKLEYMYENSLLPEAQKRSFFLVVDDNGTDMNEFNQLAELERHIDDFVLAGKNLYIHSSICGNGKTSWAVRLMRTYIEKTWPKADLSCHALFVSVPRFLLALKANIDRKNDYAIFVQEHIMEADIVIWDDIAAKMGSEFEVNHLLSLIDGRLSAGKSNIFTSNLNPEEIKMALGQRLASRICSMSTEIELHGRDKRNLKKEEK